MVYVCLGFMGILLPLFRINRCTDLSPSQSQWSGNTYITYRITAFVNEIG